MKVRWKYLAICVGLTLFLGFPAAHADDDDDDLEPLVGTWRFNVSDPGGDFFSLTQFNADNTMIDRPATSPNVGLGVGVWKAIGRGRGDDDGDRGRRRHSAYAATFDSFVGSDPAAGFEVRIRVRLTVYVNKGTLVGTGTVEVRTLDDAVLLAGPFPTATFEGTRMKVIRE